MNHTDLEGWKEELSEFKEKTEAFYSGEMNKGAYKGFSGRFGTYAQRSGTAHMLRLRMPAGRMTKERLVFTADMIRKYHIDRIHFTTCQTIQFHDLSKDALYEILEAALEAGIITMGGGGDYPRNVMCSPLSGVEQGEYFDVLFWAECAGNYLLNFINAEKMPRKLKVGFSNSKKNEPHATYRDLGFTAREDGKFDVYSAGGLGNNPLFGVKVAEGIEPEQILYYIKAMWLTFRAHGNYENRGKARTRYMQEACGGAEKYKEAFLEKLEEVFAEGEDLTIRAEAKPVTKTGDGTAAEDVRVIAQKQDGLYTVVWHPIGGQPEPEQFCALCDALAEMEAAEVRLSPDETAYIINLTGTEAKKILELTDDGAKTQFEMSVSCIGGSICQVGLRDSQALLRACVDAVREAGIPDGALPQIHISGCPSSCGTHQTGRIGFRGATKQIDGKPRASFVLYVNGNDRQGEEEMGRELGMIAETKVPEFLVELGKTAAAHGMGYEEWLAANPKGLEEVAGGYLM